MYRYRTLNYEKQSNRRVTQVPRNKSIKCTDMTTKLNIYLIPKNINLLNFLFPFRQHKEATLKGKKISNFSESYYNSPCLSINE